jgi:hypothetical protein
MHTLRTDFLHALEKEHNRQVMFGASSKNRQEETASIIEKLKEAIAEPDKWRVQLIVEPKP